jgi:hypothetical protein
MNVTLQSHKVTKSQNIITGDLATGDVVTKEEIL